MRFSLPAILAGSMAFASAAAADPIEILFVGNSFTHGRYNPVRNYNRGFDAGTGNVHDLLCPSAATCSAEPRAASRSRANAAARRDLGRPVVLPQRQSGGPLQRAGTGWRRAGDLSAIHQ